jgi:hypothetical protein
MLNREDALQMIEEAYAARVRGDKEALARYWAEGATFQIAGDATLAHGVPFQSANPMTAISELVDRFQFSDLKRLNAIVEGNTAAVRWEVTLNVAGNPPAQTQLFDLIELDDEGKIRSFVQFADTALVRRLAEPIGELIDQQV